MRLHNRLLHFSISSHFPLLLTNSFNSLYLNTHNPISTRFRSAGYGSGVARCPRPDSGAEKSNRAGSFKFNFDEDDNIDDGFGFNTSDRKRVWWSDNSMNVDDDVNDDQGFGVLEGSYDTSWIFKVLNAFGWMLPAVAISMLLGTGPNTFLMALILPIAQSTISLITDTFRGSSSGGPKPKRKRTKKNPFRRARNDTERSFTKEDKNSGEVSQNFQFREATNDCSTKTRDKKVSSFGGWDELDREVGSYRAPPNRGPSRKENEPRLEKKGKLSKRVRIRDKPLLVRLLIAVFPFLGSWTRLL